MAGQDHRALGTSTSMTLCADELSYLQRVIYQREIGLRPQRIDAYDRFSDRC